MCFFILSRSCVTLYLANDSVPVAVSTLPNTCTPLYTIDVRSAHPTEPNPDDRGIKRPQKIRRSRWRFSLSLSLYVGTLKPLRVEGSRQIDAV